ncbi:hypothetical protein [Methylotenera sp.]|uniref:hypothetical protein n=1 Tax=Methylotenera sp. TaxID=2051956 RepID=UPI002730D9EF|nr:hypothetical protein [Methylotenera sp.]MDP2070453.1 hypothetical protein [Methylotenera sp.]MDP3006267.1 hypothetical protein [Methylotenera sp.]
MKPIKLILLIAIALTGCATSEQIQGPNGSTSYFIKCGSAVIEKCYKEAAKVCPNGYTFADRQTNPNAIIMPSGNGYLMARGPNSMLIECKPLDNAAK